MFILSFSNSLLIICGVNQMPVSKSMFANLITVLSSTCFHYHCAASLILTSTIPGVTRDTIGIGQKRVRSAAGVVPCGGRKTSPRTSTIVQFIFYFGPLRSAIIF